MGPSSPRQVPPQESQTKQIKEKHKVMFKMAKREQRSRSGLSRGRWAAVPLATQKPLAEGSLGRWAKPPEKMQSLERGHQTNRCQQAVHLLPWADADPGPGLTCVRQGCPEGRAVGKGCELWEVALHQRA